MRMRWFRGLRVREVMLFIIIVALVLGWAVDHSRLTRERDWAVARWNGSAETFKLAGTAVARLSAQVEEIRAQLADCEGQAETEDEPALD